KLITIRLLRSFIKETYDKLRNGNPNYSLLSYPGRAKEIAEKLGYKTHKVITIINRLIHALDHWKFANADITSRLISLSECSPKSKFSHQGGWLISIQPPLLPYYIHNQKNDKSFILPLLEEPPVKFAHSSYQARLHILQWKLVEEFSKQSPYLLKHGFIVIDDNKWKELLKECDLPEKLLPKIKIAWTGEKGFLECNNETFYTLKKHEKELEFLKDQGKIKMASSKGGKVRANNEKMKKAKILRKFSKN
ncbi:MAG TPA: hypothetical protein VKR53_09090, partial [Puia sp.]|nr:hypothetical protein [Puia sp.]